MSELSIPQKRCSKCKEQFPQTTDYFHRCPANKDGLSYVCKGCKHGNGWKEVLPEGMRRCKKCKEVFAVSIDNFPYYSKVRQVLRHVCHSCCETQSAEYRANNLEALRQKGRERYQANPEPVRQRSKQYYEANKEKHHAYAKEWNKKHPEARKATTHREYIKHRKRKSEYGAAYRITNPEKTKQRHQRYAKENPEKLKVWVTARLARKAGAEGSHTIQEKRELYMLQDGRCGYCGIPISLNGKFGTDLDHMQPLSRGGSNSIDNLIYACPTCNRSKHDRTLDEWFSARGW